MTKREPRFIKMAQDAIAHTLRSDRLAPDVLAEHFDACWQASAREQMEADVKMIENAVIPESFHKTRMYTEFEEGGDDCLAASLRESFEREAGTPQEEGK